jgi:hypothetical protein
MALKPEVNGLEYDQEKVNDMTLALLWLTSFKDPVGVRAWKGKTGIRWNEFTQRASSLIPRAKPNRLSCEKGEERSRALFAKHFALKR